MTVKELIKKLLDYPLDAKVLISDDFVGIGRGGNLISGYVFTDYFIERFTDKEVHIVFNDWRRKCRGDE